MQAIDLKVPNAPIMRIHVYKFDQNDQQLRMLYIWDKHENICKSYY